MKSEQRPQGKYIPLRLRFRSPTDQLQLERTYKPITTSEEQRTQTEEQTDSIDEGNDSNGYVHRSVPVVTTMQTNISNNVTNDFAASRYILQVKELLHLNSLLRADLNLHDTLQHIAASTSTCTGFKGIIINLLVEQASQFDAVAFTEASEEEQQLIRDNPVTLDQLHRIILPEFRMSQSYFIPHDYVIGDLTDVVRVVANIPISDEPGHWHPEDMLIVPLFSAREHKMLGFLSLDDPEDNLVPSLESIEMVELFANQAAIAIDNAHIFQRQETERNELEQGIAEFRGVLERMRRGDLETPAFTSHPSLQPLVDVMNLILGENRAILGRMKMVTEAVDEHARSMRRASDLLVRDASQQERQVHHISSVIHEMATMMHQISERAADLSKMAVESMDVTMEGQGVVDRAVGGMSRVRETTMRSSRTLKRLSESGEEINETLLALSDLTTRMHLLALNAAIESARAGEHGQGFAVIAREIRTLASTSTDMAHKIGSYIHTVRHESVAVAQSVEQSMQQVITQTELVTETGVALAAISAVTDQMATLVQGIYDAAGGQNEGSLVVVNTVTDILHMTGEITQHMREMQESLTHLVELTNALRSRMDTFRIADLYE